MKTRYLILAWALGAVVTLMPHLAQASTESISNININARLDKQDVLDITETIDYDFGSTALHEITHDIPLSYNDDQGQRYPIRFNLVSASQDGAAINPVRGVDQTAAHLRLPATESNATLAPTRRYELHYTLSPVVLRGPSGDVFKLSATGLGWAVPVAQATFKLDAPGLRPDNFICYLGANGQASTSCEVAQAGASTTITTNTALQPGESLTVYGSFPAGSFTHYLTAYSHPTSWIIPGLAALALLVIIIGGIVLVVLRLRRRPGPPASEA